MKKLVLAVALVLVLSGCNKNNFPVISENQPLQTVTETESEENASIRYIETKLYFPDEEALKLHGESRQVRADMSDCLKARKILEMLFDGPQSENLCPSLRGSCCVNSIEIADRICTVDVAQAFVENNTGGSAQESFAIGSIVNSLCELDSVERVKINIDGNENAEFGGHFMLDAAFEQGSFSHVME